MVEAKQRETRQEEDATEQCVLHQTEQIARQKKLKTAKISWVYGERRKRQEKQQEKKEKKTRIRWLES